MDTTRLLDDLPPWALFGATVLIVMASIELGYRLGKIRRARSDQEKDAPVGSIVAATLGLLAFLLAFTFGLAASRFDARRMLVLDEANAIGTANLRAGLLPEPERSRIRNDFRQYVDARLDAVDPSATEDAIRRSEALHRDLWAQTTAVATRDPHSVVAGVFIQSLNEVIDLHSKRSMFALHNRVPELVWLVLYFIAMVAMSTLGYQLGQSGSRRSLAILGLAFTFSAVMSLIADLDRPARGMLRVNQRAMLELRASMDGSGKQPGRNPP